MHNTEMPADADPNQVEIAALALNLSSEVGADDAMLWVRIVPDRKEGLVVYGRSLFPGEIDDGRKVVVNRTIGETLKFQPGSVRFSVHDIDRVSEAKPDGYRPLTNTIWRWLSLGNPASPEQLRYLLATARRLDGTHALLLEVNRLMANLSGGFYQVSEQFLRALALAEILAVSLGRTVDLMDGIQARIGVAVPLPSEIETKKAGIRKLRNAFEHIEDRALGCVNGRHHPEALTVFDQRAFMSEGKISYAGFSIDVREELPKLLVTARSYVFDSAVKIAGEARILNTPVDFFEGK